MSQSISISLTTLAVAGSSKLELGFKFQDKTMRKAAHVIDEILNIYPPLKEAKGFIFFGTLAEAPPYDSATYSSWRLNLADCDRYDKARKAIGLVLDAQLESITQPSPRPHGFIKFAQSNITLQWTSEEIVETMLDNIEKQHKLKSYRIVDAV